MVKIFPADLLGRTLLKDSEEDGMRFRALIVRAILDTDSELHKDRQYINFICSVDGGTADEIFTYKEVLNHIERCNNVDQNDTEQFYRFCRIGAHQGPLCTSDKEYKGSTYNVLVEWDTGETTYEPMDIIAKDDPKICADYASRNGLIDTPGWKRFDNLVRVARKLNAW